MRVSASLCTVLLTLISIVGCGKPAPTPKTTSNAKAVVETESPVADEPSSDTSENEKVIEEESEKTVDESEKKPGQLKIRFVYGGDAFEPKKIVPTTDKDFCGKKPLQNERLLVTPDNKGIRNVIVYVYTGRGAAKLPPIAHTPQDIILKNEACRFEPHIVLSRNGDTLRVENPDDVGHNANISFFAQTAVNLLIPPKQFKTVELVAAQPAPIPIDCNIHPWMKAYVVVLDHPFMAVSDENGELTIEGLPTGKELTFRAYHEAGGLSEIMINGKQETWKRSRFEVEINPGMNDLGTVEVSADAMSAD